MIGSGASEREGLPTWFYGRHGLWVSRRWLLELGAGKKQDRRGRELEREDLWDPRAGGGEQGSGKAAAGVLQIWGWTLRSILKTAACGIQGRTAWGQGVLQCSNGASHTRYRTPRWELLKH